MQFQLGAPMMNPHWFLAGLSLLACIGITSVFVACNKRCQSPPEKAFNSITATDWRLITTNNPRIKNLTKFTFLVMSFKPNFTGDVKKVENNNQFDTPVLTFVYKIESSGRSGNLNITYSSVSAQPDPSSPGATPGDSQSSPPVSYEYELGRGLVLVETKTGYEYEYVPFTGIVDPDNTCTY